MKTGCQEENALAKQEVSLMIKTEGKTAKIHTLAICVMLFMSLPESGGIISRFLK